MAESRSSRQPIGLHESREPLHKDMGVGMGKGNGCIHPTTDATAQMPATRHPVLRSASQGLRFGQQFGGVHIQDAAHIIQHQ